MKICRGCGQAKPVSDFYAKRATCKACFLAKQRAHITAHPDHRRAIERRYYERHKGDCLERAATYRAHGGVREQRRRLAQRYRRAQSVRRREYQRHWRANNLELAREETRNSMHRRRARLAGVPVERFARRDIFERDGGRCAYCGRSVAADNWHLDHVVPVSKGGGHTRANVVVACPTCNLRKYDKAPDDFIRSTLDLWGGDDALVRCDAVISRQRPR
jgi:5-methylcytosine-specific restriction endonuclease McrA